LDNFLINEGVGDSYSGRMMEKIVLLELKRARIEDTALEIYIQYVLRTCPACAHPARAGSANEEGGEG